MNRLEELVLEAQDLRDSILEKGRGPDRSPRKKRRKSVYDPLGGSLTTTKHLAQRRRHEKLTDKQLNDRARNEWDKEVRRNLHNEGGMKRFEKQE